MRMAWAILGAGGMMAVGPAACSPSAATRATANDMAVANDTPPATIANDAGNAAMADTAAAPVPARHDGPADLPAEKGSVEVKPFPQEVTDYMVARDSCDHFRGEEAYSADRRAYLEENIRALCTGTDAKLAELRDHYAGDDDVVEALKGYEDHIEATAGE